IKNRNASNLRKKMVKRMSPYKDSIHTITFDNGKEFAEHERIAEQLEANVYFAHPYSSWERGLNENTNGLIRQYLPKKSDLSNIGQQTVKDIMDKLNHRPRKTLGYRTPYEVFYKTRTMLTEKVALTS
ncbi:MAG: IS30 family transposase, partial [Nitrospinota bacterium]